MMEEGLSSSDSAEILEGSQHFRGKRVHRPRHQKAALDNLLCRISELFCRTQGLSVSAWDFAFTSGFVDLSGL